MLADGTAVAVKVQHPGIDAAVRSDLSNAKLLERLAGSLLPKGFDIDRAFDEIAARIGDELDYRIEAKNQTRFGALHRNTPFVTIPAVVASHSGRRVLTSALHAGRQFDEVVTQSSAAERATYAATLWRFVFRSILVGGEFNADPHPGNYLFGPAPNVVFLDFGCVQQLSFARRLAAREVHQAAVQRDEARFACGVRQLLGTKSGSFETMALAFSRRAFEPIFASPYRVKPDFLRGLFALASDAKVDLLRRRIEPTPFPPDLALVNRLQFGFYSLLSRLDVEVDYAALQREILAEPFDG
jgi:predicted unusual protein kinase regulating ubiquinone biosynthesis (AarF/ABC1/UbiB family)